MAMSDEPEQEREQRGVAEPPQGSERELAQRLGAGAVGELGVGGHLHEVEEVQEPDPRDAGEDVAGAGQDRQRPAGSKKSLNSSTVHTSLQSGRALRNLQMPANPAQPSSVRCAGHVGPGSATPTRTRPTTSGSVRGTHPGRHAGVGPHDGDARHGGRRRRAAAAEPPGPDEPPAEPPDRRPWVIIGLLIVLLLVGLALLFLRRR